MSISFKAFAKWAKKRFGTNNVKIQGKEIRLNSVFETGDDDFHLWCSPSGGKRKHKFGTYHCFKTEKKGSLVKLVMLVDNCDRDEALARLHGQTSIRELERRLEEMFAAEDGQIVIAPEDPPKTGLSIPPECFLITDLGTNNKWRIRAEEYLQNRKIPIDGLYIGTGDRYRGRIVIPYYDAKGNLIYYNGRALGESKCKYLGPPKEIGVGKEDVVYMAGPWPEPGSLVYICEGEFNAMSLRQAEFNAVACGGKNMGEKQAMLLSSYRVVICLDRDKAGKAGTTKMSSMIMNLETAKGTKEKLSYVLPPAGYNDWNEFLVNNNPVLLHHYIRKNQKALDFSGPLGTVGDFFGFSDIWR
jgi:DNA primase